MLKEIVFAVILGGSVSSGFSGKPAPEIVVERMGLPYENNARICNRVDASEVQGLSPGTLIINLDGNYWRSYDSDCGGAVKSVKDFYAASKGLPKIMATVPDRNAGGFYRFFCAAQRSEQVCRSSINEAIREGCKDGCQLIDADDIYTRHKDVSDIHLTPEIWRAEAEAFGGR